MTIEELQSAYDQLLLDNAAMNGRLTSALASVELLNSAVQSLSADLTTATRDLAAAKGDLGVSKAQVETLQQSFDSQHRMHEDSMKTVAKLKKQLAKVKLPPEAQPPADA